MKGQVFNKWTWRCGVAYWRSESVQVKGDGFCKTGNRVLRDDGLDGGDGGNGVNEPLLGGGRERCLEIPWKKLGLLVMVWVCFFALHVVRGDRDGQGEIKIKPCGAGYWIISSLQIPLASAFTAFVLYQKDGSQYQTPNQQAMVAAPARIELQSNLIFPLMALLSGILGGLFGIGGGMLINPILLQMGIPPQITAATSSFMVLFSSSMSSVQYLMLGMKHVDHALIFAFGCFIASLLGLAIVQRAIVKYRRASLIVFSVGTVMAVSTVLITSFGVFDVWREYESGQYMGFRLPC
ncbi:sulfite exporter TauE/SafE family protein 5-like isoform X2 [Magnolia sinica]|uniref:sulfite exporter TauE/SafE family protein 5-like isoform X2 n=1 Tax=Magnolia sinica TaxID=86752 RepID=UPI002658F123|nr:sulfite exporter TauE/SafE family protein 5-like isoform X2 [Magnolia sinica]